MSPIDRKSALVGWNVAFGGVIAVALAACAGNDGDGARVVASGVSADDGAAPACGDAAFVRSVSQCIDAAAQSPRQCFHALAGGRSPCDADADGLDDDFEDALAASYSLAFAFQGGAAPETCWPGNVDAFVASSLLLYSPGGVSGTLPAWISGYKVLQESPVTSALGAASYTFRGTTYLAGSPSQNHGSNYWLCQKKAFDPAKYGGPLGPQEKLATMALAASLPGGVGSYSLVHPAHPGDGASARYVFVATELFYPYNELPLDNHEGDWEGGGVIVDTGDARGAVVAAYSDRHPSSDTIQLTPLGGAVAAIDPALDSPVASQCGDAGSGVTGIRFWDFGGARHHVVLYPASGGHAGYGYPGTTKIAGVGCNSGSLTARDVHDGDGAKLLPWLGVFASGWGSAAGTPVASGVRIVNIGEEHAPRASFATYRGQWGCQDGAEGRVGASWPGPFGNYRHCRGWLRHDWRGAPPFAVPGASADCQGL